MSVFNKRNAAVGWFTWTMARKIIHRKANNALAAKRKKKQRRGALALVAASAIGAATYWKVHSA